MPHVIMVLFLVMMRNYKKVGPNQVLVISGRKLTFIDQATGKTVTRSVRFVKGGGTIVFPFIERVDELSLEIMTLDVKILKVYTLQGSAVTVDAFAQVKIGDDEISIMAAAKQLLSKNVEQIKNVAVQTLEGHLRAILGTLSVGEINKVRDDIASRVSQAATADMANIGMTIVSFTIRDVYA